MTDVEEPQFTTLAERIAALNQAQVGRNANNGLISTAGKKPAPPPPVKPSSDLVRPQANGRSKSVNNPVTLGPSTLDARENNLPIGAPKKELLPAPVMDRDVPKFVRSCTNPPANRNLPPPLPKRTDTSLSPTLPPRRASEQLLARKRSNDSTLSVSSSISSLSNRAERSSISSVETVSGRKLPPVFDQASLPPLPPSKREADANKGKTSLTSRRSSSTVPQIKLHEPTPPPRLPLRTIEPPPALNDDKDARPIMPKRPSEEAPPRLPRRMEQPDPAPLTPPAQIMPPRMPPRPEPAAPPQPSRPRFPDNSKFEPFPVGEADIVEIVGRNYGKIVLDETKDVLVEYYLPYCKHCKALDPEYEKLAAMYHGNDKVTIAKLDGSTQKSLIPSDVQGYPTIKLFPAAAKEDPITFRSWRTAEEFEKFIYENGSKKAKATGEDTEQPPPMPKRSISAQRVSNDTSAPPPIPRASRPMTNGQQPPKKTAQSHDCLICRDYSGPDSVAKQYPRHANPDNSTDYLAEVLCGPFTSATDKARAIFTWMHHNIDYDVKAFFGNNLKAATPQNTIASGLAVCEGYARTYADIALKAGLECIVVTGHGKGYGYTQPKDGEPLPPPNPTGHAWNAVRIDNGEWKLLDACWGAGTVGNQQYNRSFNPIMFTLPNDEFGIRHFPANADHFFRSDRRRLTWEEYIIGPNPGEPLQLYGCVDAYGISKSSFVPPQKNIPLLSGATRFQFNKVCLHWDFERNGEGKPYFLVLQINGLDGREKDFVPLEWDGFYWYLDITTRSLGCKGQKVNVYAVTSVNGNDARGMDKRGYLAKKGNSGMGFNSVATWELV